jgi:hypothetical protein
MLQELVFTIDKEGVDRVVLRAYAAQPELLGLVCLFVTAPIECSFGAVAATECAMVGTCVDGAAPVLGRSLSTAGGNVLVDQIQRLGWEVTVRFGERVCVRAIVVRSI